MSRSKSFDDASSKKKVATLTKQERQEVEYQSRMLAATLESDAIRQYMIHCGKHFLEKVEVDWPTGDGNTRKIILNRYIDVPQKRGPIELDLYLAGDTEKGPASSMELRHFCLVSERKPGVVKLEAIAGQMDSVLARLLLSELQSTGAYSTLAAMKEQIDSFAATLKNQLKHAEEVSQYLFLASMRDNYRQQ
jgi:hypothetical protein